MFVKNTDLHRCHPDRICVDLSLTVQALITQLQKNLKTENASVFSVHITTGELRNLNNYRSFWICVCGQLGQLKRHRKTPFLKWLPSTLKFEASLFQIPPVLKSAFEKLRFRDGLVWTVGLTVKIKLCF